jgi:hypothetical protein
LIVWSTYTVSAAHLAQSLNLNRRASAIVAGGHRRLFAGCSLGIAILAWLVAIPASAGQVNLAWNASPAPTVVGYYVHYGVASHAYTSRIDAGNRTTYTVPNLTSGRTYFFAVTAYDAARNESPPSNEVSSTISVIPPPQPTFVDVAPNHWAYGAIEAIAYHSITLGCATNPLRFCPDGDIGRDEMAVFLERTTRGIGYHFAPTGSRFADVPITHWAVGPIEQLHIDGITQGCAVSPLRFCPDSIVSRAEMAILLLRARFGPGYNPGNATGVIFADVPATHWAAAWIERFAALGYTNGCADPGNFCPNHAVTRAGMAVFLQRVFNLTGPPS